MHMPPAKLRRDSLREWQEEYTLGLFREKHLGEIHAIKVSLRRLVLVQNIPI